MLYLGMTREKEGRVTLNVIYLQPPGHLRTWKNKLMIRLSNFREVMCMEVTAESMLSTIRVDPGSV